MSILRPFGRSSRPPAPVVSDPVDPITVVGGYVWFNAKSRNTDANGVTLNGSGYARTVYNAFSSTDGKYIYGWNDSTYGWSDPEIQAVNGIVAWQFGIGSNIDDYGYDGVAPHRGLMGGMFTKVFNMPFTEIVTFKLEKYVNSYQTIVNDSVNISYGLQGDSQSLYMYNSGNWGNCRINVTPMTWNCIVLYWKPQSSGDCSYILNNGPRITLPVNGAGYMSGLVLGNKPPSQGQNVFYGWIADVMVYDGEIAETDARGISAYMNQMAGGNFYFPGNTV